MCGSRDSELFQYILALRLLCSTAYLPSCFQQEQQQQQQQQQQWPQNQQQHHQQQLQQLQLQEQQATTTIIIKRQLPVAAAGITDLLSISRCATHSHISHSHTAGNR